MTLWLRKTTTFRRGSFTGKGKEQKPKVNIPASFPAADQEIHGGSLPEKLGNLPFLHIV